MRKNPTEDKLINALDDAALWNQLGPVIKAILRHGNGNADQLIQKSQAVAAIAMIESLKSEKEDIKLRAATELLNRSLGKPVERRIDLYADLNNVSDKELDNRIKTLVNQIGAPEVIDAVFEEVPKMRAKQANRAKERLKQSRRKDNDLEDVLSSAVGEDVEKPIVD